MSNDRPPRVVLDLAPFEYETIVCALEAAAAGGVRLPEDLQKDARETWERLLIEGGHITLREFKRLQKIR